MQCCNANDLVNTHAGVSASVRHTSCHSVGSIKLGETPVSLQRTAHLTNHTLDFVVFDGLGGAYSEGTSGGAGQPVAEIQDCVNILYDPATTKATGKAIIRMRSVRQAQLVASEIKELVFMVGKGPCPIEASVVRPGAVAFTALLFHYALLEHTFTSLRAILATTMLHYAHSLRLCQVNEQPAHMVALAYTSPKAMVASATPRLAQRHPATQHASGCHCTAYFHGCCLCHDTLR